MNIVAAVVFTTIYSFRLCYQGYILLNREKTTQKGAWSELLLVVVSKNILVVVAIYMLCIGVPFTSIFWIGWIIFIFGIVLRLISLNKLGPMFSLNIEIRKNHKFVKTGIYSLVRHPLYLASFIDTLGIVIFLQEIYLYLFLLPIVIGLNLRIINEEKELEKFFGNEYMLYKFDVPRLNILKNLLKLRNI